jgi:hypothetical protein
MANDEIWLIVMVKCSRSFSGITHFTSVGLKMGRNAIGVLDCGGTPPLFPAIFESGPMLTETAFGRRLWVKKPGACFQNPLEAAE